MWNVAVCASPGNRSYQEDTFAFVISPDSSLASVICDGMGGDVNGLRCSTAASEHLIKYAPDLSDFDFNTLPMGQYGPVYKFPPVPTMPRRGGTTALAFYANSDYGVMMSCGDSQGIIFAVNDDGSLTKVGLAHNACTGKYRNMLLECWDYYTHHLSLDAVISLNRKYLVILASDGIDTLIPEVCKQQAALVKDSIIPLNDGVVVDQSFIELIGNDLSDVQVIADRIVNAAVAAANGEADNTTVLVALFQPNG